MSRKHRRKPYMPDSDVGKKMWMERFLRELSRDPARYGFDDERMWEYTQRTIRTFIDAAQAAANKGTRSASAVAEKNRARKEAVAMCRDIAMRLKHDPSISLNDLRALGIRADEAAPERAKLPQGKTAGLKGVPELIVQSSVGGGHVIRYRDPTTESKARPKGVSHLLLFAAIGEKPNMRRTHARLLGAYTKRPFEIKWPIACGIDGLYVTYYGRWLTTRGEMSPWSKPVSKIIAETQVSLRDSEFGHLFEKEGFIDALPQGLTEGFAEDRPLLEGVASERDRLLHALEAKMLPWQGFALLEAELPGMAARVEDAV